MPTLGGMRKSVILATNVKAQPISTTERTFFMKPRISLGIYEELLTEYVTSATDGGIPESSGFAPVSRITTQVSTTTLPKFFRNTSVVPHDPDTDRAFILRNRNITRRAVSELHPFDLSVTTSILGRHPTHYGRSHFIRYGQRASLTNRNGSRDYQTICARFKGFVTSVACIPQELNQQHRQSEHREYDEGGPACVMRIALVRQGKFTNTLSPV